MEAGAVASCQWQETCSFSSGKENPDLLFAEALGFTGMTNTLTCFSSKQSVGGLAAFRAFLKSEYSEENIDFWVSCEEYKKTKSPAKLSPKARKIYDEFISVQATKEVCTQNIAWA